MLADNQDLTVTVTGKLDPAVVSDFRRFMASVLAVHQRAADEDGGMHLAGVEILLAYEAGGTVDDCMMKLFA